MEVIRIEVLTISRKSNDLVNQAYNYLLDMIMTKKLMPGERVPEQQVAEDSGISRSPVRDAMRRLANEGLINIYPYRFAEISKCDQTMMREIGTIRLALDNIAIKLVLLYGSRSDFISLRQLAHSCWTAFEEKDHERRIQYDLDFHLMLSEISQNALLLELQKSLSLRVQFLILHHPFAIGVEERHLMQHFELIDKIEQNDESEAMEIINNHIISFYGLKDNYPGLFLDHS